MTTGLGLSVYHTAGTFSPRLEYNAKSGRLSRVDRTADGSDTIRVDLTMQRPSYAWDLGSIEIGWANFQAGAAPSLVMVPYGQPMPARPDRDHKAGFRSKVWDGREAFSREFSATAGVTVNAIEALWDQLIVMPEASAGKIPVIQLVNVIAISAQRGTNYAPEFRLLQWLDRSEAIFGPRTVAAPGQPTIAPAQAQPVPLNGAIIAPSAWQAPPATAPEPPRAW